MPVQEDEEDTKPQISENFWFDEEGVPYSGFYHVKCLPTAENRNMFIDKDTFYFRWHNSDSKKDTGKFRGECKECILEKNRTYKTTNKIKI